MAFAALLALLGGEGSVRERAVIGIVGGIGVVLAVFVFTGPERLRSFENFKKAAGPQAEIIKYEWNHIIRTDHASGAYILDGEAATATVGWDDSTRAFPSSILHTSWSRHSRGWASSGSVAECRSRRRGVPALLTSWPSTSIPPSIAG